MDTKEITKWLAGLPPEEFARLAGLSLAPVSGSTGAAQPRRRRVYPPGDVEGVVAWSVDVPGWLAGGATLEPVRPKAKRAAHVAPVAVAPHPVADASPAIHAGSPMDDLKAEFARRFPDDVPHGNAGRKFFLGKLGLEATE